MLSMSWANEPFNIIYIIVYYEVYHDILRSISWANESLNIIYI